MIEIRAEQPKDIRVIGDIITAAFSRGEPRSGTEAAIVEALRTFGALTTSLVAVEGEEVVGHVAFSPVATTAGIGGWFGLGPVAVRPDRQRRGIGRALIEAGLTQLRANGAGGCVVLGEPRYYARFGFVSDPMLRYAGVPAECFRRILFKGPLPTGEVAYHPGFNAT